MAHGALCMMRLASGDSVLEHLELAGEPTKEFMGRVDRDTLHLISIAWAGTFNNGYKEISAPNAIFDGTVTPAVVYVDSTSGDDTAAGDGVQQVTIIGILEDGTLGTVAVETGGTTGQSSVTKFQRIFHAYASRWGSGNDPVGDIYIQDDATGTVKYLKMAAGTNETEGAEIFLPTGYKAVLDTIALTMTSSANANSAILVKASGININGMGADPEYLYNEWRTVISSGGVHASHTDVRLAQAGAKITFSETYKGSAEDGLFHVHILIWN